MRNTYYHHFFARGCELAGCDAPDGRCDLYLLEGWTRENAGAPRAVRACCGAHAREAREQFLEGVPEPEPALDGYDFWARCAECGELTDPGHLEAGEGFCLACAAANRRAKR